MKLTQHSQMALNAAILAYLTAQGDRFARTAVSFMEEAQFSGTGEVCPDSDFDKLLELAWEQTVERRFETE